MLLGNLASIALAIAGILQALSWTIAGAMILAILSITTLAPTKSSTGTGTGRSTSKKMGHPAAAETKSPYEKGPQKQTATRLERQSPRDEPPRSPSLTKSEFQKAMTPRITPPKNVPTSFSPAKPNPSKPGTPKEEAIRPIPVGRAPPVLGTVKPALPRMDPNTRLIAQGDYATFDVELSQRAEVTCEVKASAPVNIYLMDADNLNSLDLGEEFWSEAGEEVVQTASLHFVAPQSGKWFLVVENTDNKEVTATAIIRKAPAKTGPVSS
jgi:hypothetical protein